MLFCRSRGHGFWPLLDVLVPAVALGQAIGRWGNFFNSEAFGLPTALPWKLRSPIEHRPPDFLAEPLFHPPFLHDSLLNSGVFVLLLVLFRCGLRVSELVSLKISDLHREAGILKVTGKGNKERLVPFPASLSRLLENYMQHVRSKVPVKHGEEDIVFLNRNGKRLTRVMVFIVVL